MEELLNNIAVLVIMTIVFLFTYVGFHMSVEKDKGKRIPLAWEEDGFLRKLFTKSK
jgi:hypothetical protein